ncbi:MAG TPA: hypothetical protein DDZ80_01075 [Cyanobacteria bacterium UBA8803]|nr:hypothetical protein [Cyanobacteria bacterium UBA9273]HBL57199.1 hypothetical protein [Cyanobacteria bacterium UBA8803]
MSTGSYENNSLAWQLQQVQQRVGEWWELQVSRFLPSQPDEPDLSWLSWLNSPILAIIAKAVFWLLLAFLLSWTALQFLQRWQPYIKALRNPLSQLSDRETTTSVRELSVAGWLERSQKFQQQENYREACLCLYRAMLQRLHDRGVAPHQLSRTDGEYLELVQQLPQPRSYQVLLMTHQQLCFSNADASSSLLEQCQQAYREIGE